MSFDQMFFWVALGLVVFGGLYDHVVGWLENQGHSRGYTSLLVVGGVGVTLIASIPLVGLNTAVLMLALFGASGLPMIIGSVARYARERARDDQQARDVARKLLEESNDE